MTVKFDDSARNRAKKQARLFDQFDSSSINDTSSLKITKCPMKLAREYIATYHYMHLMPDSTREAFMGRYGTSLAGIITFGTGCSMNIFRSLIPDISAENCRELTRLWSPDGMPKNTESKLIMGAIRKLPSDVRLIVSFSDPSAGHVGTVYQATNFYYCGMSAEGHRLENKDGQGFHQRNVGIYRLRHPELSDKSDSEIMNLYGWTKVPSPGKYRYVMLRGTRKEKAEMYERIKDKILPYPKKVTEANELGQVKE